MSYHKIDQYVEQFYRIYEFRKWIQTNVLFPQVPDTIVRPLREQLLAAELRLMSILHEYSELDKIVEIQKMLELDVRK